jgi:HEAT repeat protein
MGKLTGKKTPEQLLNIKTPQDRHKELVELAKDAGDKSPAEQERIVAELAKEIQHEEDAMMRRQILRTLGEYRTPLAMAILEAGLKDTDLEVRRVACNSIGTQGGPQAVQALTYVFNSDTEKDVRIAAVKALGQTADKAAMTPLAEALVDPNPAIQFRAQESLRTVSGRDYGNNVQAWREYAKTGNTTAEEISFAERVRRSIF